MLAGLVPSEGCREDLFQAPVQLLVVSANLGVPWLVATSAIFASVFTWTFPLCLRSPPFSCKYTSHWI